MSNRVAARLESWLHPGDARYVAKAVLAVMREPTGAMIEAGDALQTDELGDPCPMTAASVWRVMIEAGLKE